MSLFSKTVKFFDKTEDKTRSRLSRHPIVYATIGGVGLALFWKGIWIINDYISLKIGLGEGLISGIILVLLSFGILLATGLFVSFFIGDRIMLSGLKQEKKLEEKTKEEVEKEIGLDVEIKNKVDKIEHDVGEIIAALKEEHEEKNNEEKTNSQKES